MTANTIRPVSGHSGALQHHFYHVTLTANHNSIKSLGIEPIFSRGKQKTSWFVDNTKLSWALAHCSVRYSVPVTELEVWLLPKSYAKRFRRTQWSGVFQTECNHKVVDCLSAQEILESLRNN